MILKCEGTTDSLRFFLFAQETEGMVGRLLMGLLQAWNHCLHVCLFPSPLHAYVHIYLVGAFRLIKKVAS